VTRRPTVPLLVALACVLGIVVTGVLALDVAAVHTRDAAALHGFTDLDRPRVHGLFVLTAGLMDPVPYGLMGMVLAWFALRSGRRARAVSVVVLLVATGATTQVLKHIISSPRFDGWLGDDQVGPSAFPSGHSTAAMTLALCFVLVAPPARRALAATVASLSAAAVGYSLVVLAWHYPSDVLAGYLVAGAWTAAALAVLRLVEARLDRGPIARHPRVLVGLAAGPTVALGAAALTLIVARGREATLYAAERPTLVACALAIAALAGALAAGFAREA